METVKRYQVEITLLARLHYFEILEYFYEYMSYESATKYADDLFAITGTLETLPDRGSIESSLQHFKKEHRYLLYKSSAKKTIKVIYFVDKKRDVVWVTDFFPTLMDEKTIKNRNT